MIFWLHPLQCESRRNKAINNKNHFKWFRFLWIWFLSTPFIMTLVSCHSSSLVQRTAFFFVLEISLMQSNSVVISFDCMRFFLFIFCEMWLWKSAYMRIVLIYPLRECREKKTDRTSPYGIRSFSIWSTLCGSPVLCRVVCALWKIIIIRNNFLCSFVYSFATTPGWCWSCFWYQ